MLPELIAAPFALLSAALPNTNITDIARVFNESNITTTGNFTFEPNTLLFVNYPQSSGHREFDSLLLAAGTGNGTYNESLSISTLAGSGGNSTENDEEYCDEGDLGEHSNSKKNGTDKFLADLSSTSALQVSLNTTLNSSSIKEAPIFAVNGTYSDSEMFFVGIFHFLNSSSDACRVHYLGGNFTARSIFGGMISVLTNSTPALLEYIPPLDIDVEETTGSFVYLLFSQSSEFHYSKEWFSSVSHNQTVSISLFIEETGLSSPIGGSMIWLTSDGDSTGNEGSSLTLEGSIPADVYTASPSPSDADGSSLSDSDASTTGTATESDDSDFFTPTGSETGEPAPSQTTTDDFSSGEPDTELETDGSNTEAFPSETDSGFPSESETGSLEPSESAGDFDENDNPDSSTGTGPLESGTDDWPSPSGPTDGFSEPGTGTEPTALPSGSDPSGFPEASDGSDPFPTATEEESGEGPSATGDDSGGSEPDQSSGPGAIPSASDSEDFSQESGGTDEFPTATSGEQSGTETSGTGDGSDFSEPGSFPTASDGGSGGMPPATGSDGFPQESDTLDTDTAGPSDTDSRTLPVPKPTDQSTSDGLSPSDGSEPEPTAPGTDPTNFPTEDSESDTFDEPSNTEFNPPTSTSDITAAPSFTDGGFSHPSDGTENMESGGFHPSFEGDSDRHNTGGASDFTSASDFGDGTETMDSSFTLETFDPTEFLDPSVTDNESEMIPPMTNVPILPTEDTQSHQFGGPEITGTSPDGDFSILPVDETFSESFGGPSGTELDLPSDFTDFPSATNEGSGDYTATAVDTETGGSHSSFGSDSEDYNSGGASEFASTSAFDDSFGPSNHPTGEPNPSETGGPGHKPGHDDDIPWCDELQGGDENFSGTASETATATAFRRWLRFDRGEYRPLF